MDDALNSYLHRPTDYYYNYKTIPERMDELAAAHAGDEIYVFQYPDGRRDSISAQLLFEKSKTLAKSLMKLGVNKGDIVAACLPNDKNALICTFGAIFAGAIISHLHFRQKDGKDLQEKLSMLCVQCLVLDPGVQEENYKACISFIDAVDADGRTCSNKVPTLKLLLATSPVNGENLLQLEDLQTGVSNDGITLPRLDPEEVVALFTTSGSTGEPKFVPHTHHDVMIFGNQAKESISYDENDVLYTERRMAWLGGFPLMFLHDCVKVVTLTHPIADLTEHSKFTYDVIKSEKCTIACLFPATVAGLLNMVSKREERPVHILKSIHIGGLTLAPNCMDAIGILTKQVTNCYGTTEGGILTSNHVEDKHTYETFCTGKPIGGTEIKVVDAEAYVVKRGQMGSIHVRSPCMALYYYGGSEIKTSVSMVNRWVDTEDVGYITEGGELVVCGRKSDVKDVLYTGGRYMRGLTSYLEATVKNDPNVLDAVAVTAPDDVFVEIVCVCVVVCLRKKVTTDDLENFYRAENVSATEVLEGFEQFLIFDSFPKLYTGKPDRRALREEVLRRRKDESQQKIKM